MCFQYLPPWPWSTDPTLDSDWSGQFLWRSIILGIYLNIWLRPPPLSFHADCWTFSQHVLSVLCYSSICRKYSVRQHCRVNTDGHWTGLYTADQTSRDYTRLNNISKIIILFLIYIICFPPLSLSLVDDRNRVLIYTFEGNTPLTDQMIGYFIDQCSLHEIAVAGSSA